MKEMRQTNEITKSVWIARDIKEIWIRNLLIGEKFQAGQFLVIHQSPMSERIPLTIVEASQDNVRIIVQRAGYSTARLCELKKGDTIRDVAGPLGVPSRIKLYGKTVCLAGGIGAAPLKPVALKLKEAGNQLTIIEGVRSKEYLILKDELESMADKFFLTSDDGSVGEKGLVTVPLSKMIKNGDIPDFVFAVGPPLMMQAVAEITRAYNIPLTVSLNPIMVDGTGMCGSCRVEVGGHTMFACVAGPEFDGNEVNYKLLINRLKMYDKEEEVMRRSCRH